MSRKPSAFRLDPEPAPSREPVADAPPRRPRALDAQAAIVTPSEIDVFDEPDIVAAEPPPVPVHRRRFSLWSVFATAFGVLVSLAIGLWTDELIRNLFSRADWLGWVAVGAATLAALSLVFIVAREIAGVMRLASAETLRDKAADALARNDPAAARGTVDALAALLHARPETAAGRKSLEELRDDIIDGPDLLAIAERELLLPLDERAKVLILDAAKRVSLVTAVSPRALVDLAYVLFEAGKLIRRIAELYGGRPGTVGFLRLARGVLAHLAVTGSIAAGDSLVHQLVGQGLAARLSAKLGEGVVNGMMTVRIGLAAMETVRPLPFTAIKKPGIGDFMAALATYATRRAPTEDSGESRRD